MSKVYLHPRHCRRFYSAVDNVVCGIRDASLESELGKLGENECTQIIVDAVVTELRAPVLIDCGRELKKFALFSIL